MNLERKFQSMSVTLSSSNYPNAVELFTQICVQHGSQIRKLSLVEADFKRVNELYDILSSLPLLEVLEISRTKFTLPACEELSCIQPVQIRKLKSLKVDRSNWILFQYSIGSQITSLATTGTVIRPGKKWLINFLEASTKLESIEFDFVAFSNVFQSRLVGNFPFKLRRFKYISYSYSSENAEIDENFERFLESQAPSLQELVIGYASAGIVATIFLKLKFLKKLRINSVSLPHNQEFYDGLKPSLSLTEVTCHDIVLDETAARGFLGNCPNLESLKAIHDSVGVISSNLQFIARHNPKLKALSIETLGAQLKPEVRFGSLKFIHLQHVEDVKVLLSFLGSNSTIETLSVREVVEENLIDEFVEALLGHPNVNYLRLGGSFEAIKKIYDKIKVDYGKLKSLELNLILENGTEVPTAMLKFPDDPANWDVKCEVFDDC